MDDSIAIGFAIRTESQGVLEDNVREDFQYDPERLKDAVAKGYVIDGRITESGWEKLNEGFQQAELNALNWLRDTFCNARDEGHGDNDLIGTLWVDPHDEKHIEALRGEWLSEGTVVHNASSGALNDIEDVLLAGLDRDFSYWYAGVASIEFFNIPAEVEDLLS